MMIGYAKVRAGGRSRAGRYWTHVIELCREGITKAPVYVELTTPSAPRTIINSAGVIVYEEIPRPGEETVVQYVNNLLKEVQPAALSLGRSPEVDDFKIGKYDLAIGVRKRLYQSRKFEREDFSYRNGPDSPPSPDASVINTPSDKESSDPFVCLKTKEGESWKFNADSTRRYLTTLHQIATTGTSFKGTYALITGAGEGSIGCDILKGLLQGGASVVVTTSRSSPKAFKTYQEIYTKYGGRGSQLIVVPFNQGSKKDVETLIEYIYSDSGLGWDLDFIIPFAAISVGGQDITNIDSRSELAHRLMMTNLLRMLGCVMERKKAKGNDTNPAHVLLPLSPNHGTFGNDGLYSESKLALEAAFSKWKSESWENYLGVCGAVIGWTRGTGLMNANNRIAEGIENEGVRTFSTAEMAFHLIGLLSPEVREMCTKEPVFANLSGGLLSLSNLSDLTVQVRSDLAADSELRKALHREQQLDTRRPLADKVVISPRVNFDIAFPTLPQYGSDNAAVSKDLLGVIDLERTVVVTGYAELGPWGNARTRWEMEANGKFSLEGCFEMAWIMGLIKSHNGPIDGKQYVGWVDAKTGSPVVDNDIWAYESKILEHTGIRIMEPETLYGYDPQKRAYLQEIAINEDLAAFEASQATAEAFKLQHGDKVAISELGPDQFSVRILKGATLMVPKAMPMDRFVAGILPTGWDPLRYGIPQDIVDQVDPVTLYALVSVSEALIQAGITDPYEIYKHIHLSELGNCIGSGAGGYLSLKKIFKDRYFDTAVQSDILAVCRSIRLFSLSFYPALQLTKYITGVFCEHACCLD
jgi:fatty acid synthase subunit alpha